MKTWRISKPAKEQTFLLLLPLALLFLLSACGGEDKNSSLTGSIPIQIVWPQAGSAQQAGVIASPTTICPTCTTLSGTHVDRDARVRGQGQGSSMHF